MKDLIFISANCPYDEQVAELEKCIDSLLDSNFHILIVSHTHIPFHIQKKCHYYFYDFLNEISTDVDMIGYWNYNLGNGTSIHSRFFQRYFYGFAIYRMNSIASNVARIFGYEKIHKIEYDCRILDNRLLEENSQKLEEFDSVFYTNDGTRDGELFGSLLSLRVDKLPDLFLNYNKENIQNEIKKQRVDKLGMEQYSKDLFNKGNSLAVNVSSLNGRFEMGKSFFKRKHFSTLFYDQKSESLNFFYLSKKDEETKIIVIVNSSKVFNITVKPHHWHLLPLGLMVDIDYVRIDDTVNVFYEMKFDNEFREIFKRKSYLKYEI